jgi:hypothetical protein
VCAGLGATNTTKTSRNLRQPLLDSGVSWLLSPKYQKEPKASPRQPTLDSDMRIKQDQQTTIVSQSWTRIGARREAKSSKSSSAGAGLGCLLVGEPRCQEQPTASRPRQPLLDSGMLLLEKTRSPRYHKGPAATLASHCWTRVFAGREAKRY